MDGALLFLRLVVGLAMIGHGTQKLFGWFGGYGLAGTGGFFESLGFRPGPVFALFAGLGEAGGGALIALGLFGSLGPAAIVMVMLVAIFTVHISKGFFAPNGWELNSVYIAAAVTIAYAGAGAYSLDRAFGFTLFTATLPTCYLMTAAIVLAILNLFVRRPAQQQQ
ncbi:MAG TPA: DoxX family protein [Candidatus Acidoferrales bacterium]|nr:DoxX family protein [Candidatus Acidoferrales bacterium]